MTLELRTYTTAPGQIEKLLERFRNHTLDIFPTHGIHSIAYWQVQGQPDILIYLVRHDNDPSTNWASFQADPHWIEVKKQSEADGPVVLHVTSYLLSPTDIWPEQISDRPIK
ncbi:NIPSNAP family protein [Pseudarthrobacter equi]|uniref:NIPSNAP family protein n=1 Tax=Pseudarthrobacter TaxID=1742993 RepID=UPI001584BEA0|nr:MULTISPECIES: NIPSNAP family protein [Pseudarthrobacter]MCT9625997.1 NIPSNAP family protein [Pseudarthrobacter equi]NUT72150.1 NIPSNAP family protein [Pseudarthrobacter sp. C4D7]